MENSNSNDYLEKIKIQVIENLKKTTFAPSVQMQDVPREPLGGMTEEEEAELDDLDEDENKDTRHTQRRWDAHVTRDDELDESDDEEESRKNGVLPQNGTIKRRNMMDYQNPNAVPDNEAENGVSTPEPMEVEVDGITPAMATEVNAEVVAEVMQNKHLDLTLGGLAEAGPSNAASRADSPRPVIVDEEGDVDMTEPSADQADAALTATAISHVVTPPISPAPSVTQATAADPRSPTPAAAIPDTVAETSGVAASPTALKEEGEAERDGENVTAEASTEIAAQSQE
jgi:histone deacetylase 1/2